MQPFSAAGVVVFCFGVLAAVEFDAELFFFAVEVEDVATERVLTSEFGVCDAAVAQQVPEQEFGIGHAGA